LPRLRRGNSGAVRSTAPPVRAAAGTRGRCRHVGAAVQPPADAGGARTAMRLRRRANGKTDSVVAKQPLSVFSFCRLVIANHGPFALSQRPSPRIFHCPLPIAHWLGLLAISPSRLAFSHAPPTAGRPSRAARPRAGAGVSALPTAARTTSRAPATRSADTAASQMRGGARTAMRLRRRANGKTDSVAAKQPLSVFSFCCLAIAPQCLISFSRRFATKKAARPSHPPHKRKKTR
jgi:hypothetical protein